MGFSDHLQLNLDISNTDISNKMNMWKWFVSPKHLFFYVFYPPYLEYSDIFKFLNSPI